MRSLRIVTVALMASLIVAVPLLPLLVFLSSRLPSLSLSPADSSALVSTLAGPHYGADGRGAAANFRGPHGVALSADGTFALVADTDNHTIRQVVVATGEVRTLAGSPGEPGDSDGRGAAARFDEPRGVALSADGRTVLIADTGNHSIRRITTRR